MKKFENFCRALYNLHKIESNVAHSYSEDVAKGIVRNTRERYICMFEDLKTRIERGWRQ